MKKPENQSFEESMNELENIVENLEQGDLSLEDSMKAQARGRWMWSARLIVEANGKRIEWSPTS